MNILERALAPTPKFFKNLRLLGLILSAVSAVLIGRSESTAAISVIAEHIATAGAVIMAVSQVTVDEEALEVKQKAKSGHG